MAEQEKGTVKWFSVKKCYGYIAREDKNDIFIHKSDWEGPGDGPQEGEQVIFEIGQSPKGPKALHVRPAESRQRIQRSPFPQTSQPRQSSRNQYRFLNPYNFVRPLPKSRPEPSENNVLGNYPSPPHDRYLEITGRITCKVEAQTPLFVSDSHETTENDKGHRSYRFFQYKEKPALPASSLRGMVRSVFEAATNSCFAIFDGGGFDLREGRMPEKLVPARVVKIDNSGAKLEILDCSQGLPTNASIQGPNKMKAAVILAYSPKVLNTNTDETFDPAQSKIPINLKDGERVAALVNLQAVPGRGGRYHYFVVETVVPTARHASLTETPGVTKKVFGYIHITGPNIENKHFERFFFRWDDDTLPQAPEWGDIPTQREVRAETLAEYKEHLKNYWDRHQNSIEKLNKTGSHWPITPDALPHPSYFIEKDRKLCEGDVLYYIPKSEKGFPVLRPILMSRLPYKYTRLDLLKRVKHLHPCQDFNSLCPACRVFGWVSGEMEPGQDKLVAYAGRVRFSHGELQSPEATPMSSPTTLAILSSPKPTTCVFYLRHKDGDPDSNITYNNDGAQLRGRKFYRHHGKNLNPQEYTREPKADQNRTVFDALPKKTTFTFTVDFENLSKVELGALLWALEFDGNGTLFHRLGYAKPLGFGSVTIKVTKVEQMLPGERYRSLAQDGGWKDVFAEKDDLKTIFKKAMESIYLEKPSENVTGKTVGYKQYLKGLSQETFESLPNIQDLKALLSEPEASLPIHYPRPSDEPGEDENFRWFVKNTRLPAAQKQVLALAPEDTEGLHLQG